MGSSNTIHTMSTQNRKGFPKRRPLYHQTAEVLGEILENMEPGTFLPSEPTLAKQLGISRATLREAMSSCEERGLIVRRQGVGTYVTRPLHILEAGLETLESIETIAARIGLAVDMGDLLIRERKADQEESFLFQIDEGTLMVEVSRVILTDDQPVAYLVDLLPREIFPDEILEKGFTGSVLDLLLRRGEPALGFSRTEITAVPASPEITRHLKIDNGDSVLYLEACLYSYDGQVVDHSFSYFVPGRFYFHVVRRVGN
jgi:GntR family transcriptional regulator